MSKKSKDEARKRGYEESLKAESFDDVVKDMDIMLGTGLVKNEDEEAFDEEWVKAIPNRPASTEIEDFIDGILGPSEAGNKSDNDDTDSDDSYSSSYYPSKSVDTPSDTPNLFFILPYFCGTLAYAYSFAMQAEGKFLPEFMTGLLFGIGWPFFFFFNIIFGMSHSYPYSAGNDAWIGVGVGIGIPLLIMFGEMIFKKAKR